MNFQIRPLSNKNVNDAVDLLVQIFHPLTTDVDDPRKWLPASLAPEENQKIYNSLNVTFLKYYVAAERQSKRIIGVAGIYSIKQGEKDADWLAWFCVNPKFRGKGIGTKLLEFIIDKAKQRGKKFLKLYTSNNKDLEQAKKLYEKFGFKTFKTEINKKGEKVDYMKKFIRN